MGVVDKVPPWLHTNAPIQTVLHALLRLVDEKPFAERKHAPAITLTQARHPAFFVHLGDQDAAYLWALMEELAAHSLLELKRDSNRVLLLPAGEAPLRQWLNHPADNAQARWQAAVDAVQSVFSGDAEKLRLHPQTLGDLPADALVACYVRLGQALRDMDTGQCSLRQLSARHFYGLSKYLDGKDGLLSQVFPKDVAKIALRPVVLQIYWTSTARQWLWVENLDTFLSLMNQPAVYERTVLIYSQGFKGTAARLRTPEGVRLSFFGEAPSRTTLNNTWFSPACDWPAYFWGDLDYSALNMLGRMRQSFPVLQAWQPGYAPMVRALLDGAGHPPSWDPSSGKDNQTPPPLTGCAYADIVLLPALQTTGRFLDQEGVVLSLETIS